MGKCKICYIPFFGVSLAEASYMRIANAIIISVNKVLLKSNTRLLAGLEPCSTLFENKEASSYCTSSIARGDFSPKMKDFTCIDDYLDEIVKYCMKYSVGNCGEFALLGYYSFKSKYLDFNLKEKGVLQLCGIKGGDHSFLVIGELENPRSIIIDPWAKTRFFMYERYTKLKNYNRGTLENLMEYRSGIYTIEFRFKGEVKQLKFNF